MDWPRGPMDVKRSAMRAMDHNLFLYEIIEISFATEYEYDDMWWSLPADRSADLMRQFPALEMRDEMTLTFDEDCLRPSGTNPRSDGTNYTSYTLDFATMEQKNNVTGVVRPFRIVQVICAPDRTIGLVPNW